MSKEILGMEQVDHQESAEERELLDAIEEEWGPKLEQITHTTNGRDAEHVKDVLSKMREALGYSPDKSSFTNNLTTVEKYENIFEGTDYRQFMNWTSDSPSINAYFEWKKEKSINK